MWNILHAHKRADQASYCPTLRCHQVAQESSLFREGGGKRCFFGNGVVVVVRNKISKRRAAPR